MSNLSYPSNSEHWRKHASSAGTYCCYSYPLLILEPIHIPQLKGRGVSRLYRPEKVTHQHPLDYALLQHLQS